MAMTASEFARCLAQRGHKFFCSPEDGRFGLDVGGLQGDMDVRIQLDEDGEFVAFRIRGYLSVPTDKRDAGAAGAFFQALAEIHYLYKMVRFEFDPSDGEVVASVEIPIEDGSLTSEQVGRALHALMLAADQFRPYLQATLDSGAPPCPVKTALEQLNGATRICREQQLDAGAAKELLRQAALGQAPASVRSEPDVSGIPTLKKQL
jgi:hypothetical protein